MILNAADEGPSPPVWTASPQPGSARRSSETPRRWPWARADGPELAPLFDSPFLCNDPVRTQSMIFVVARPNENAESGVVKKSANIFEPVGQFFSKINKRQ